MSGRKLPPSQKILTQMSRHAKKRRCAEATLSSLAENSRTRKLISLHVVSTVSRHSTTLFGDIAADNNNAIDSDEDDEQKSPVSPYLLPVVKFTKSLNEKYHNNPPLSPCVLPVLVPKSVSKKGDEAGQDEDEDDKCERKYLDIGTKKWIRKYNQLCLKCERLKQMDEFYRHRACVLKDRLYDICEMATSCPNSPESP